MQMEDGLSGIGAHVEDGAIAVLDPAFAGDVRGSEMAAADDFGVSVGASFSPERWRLGTMRTWVGAWGSMSAKARVCSSS